MSARLHIFRAGTYTDLHGQAVTLTAADVAAAAAAYDPDLSQAPIVVGHPATNAPAFGWIASLSAVGPDLEGEPIQVDPEFAAAVRGGRYKTRSASFWPPAHPANPKPGVWYLRHVGFLGGVAPAVKGLRGADLAEPDTALACIELAGAPPAFIDPETPAMSETDSQALASRAADLAAREAELDRQAQQLAIREQAIASQEAARRRAEVVAFAEGLATQARILPADVPRLTEILLALDAHAAAPAACFAEGEGEPQSAGAWLRGHLAARAPLVELAEVATKARAGAGALRPADFAAPAGYRADPAALALHAKAKAYQADHPNTDYKAAVAAVSTGA